MRITLFLLKMRHFLFFSGHLGKFLIAVTPICFGVALWWCASVHDEPTLSVLLFCFLSVCIFEYSKTLRDFNSPDWVEEQGIHFSRFYCNTQQYLKENERYSPFNQTIVQARKIMRTSCDVAKSRCLSLRCQADTMREIKRIKHILKNTSDLPTRQLLKTSLQSKKEELYREETSFWSLPNLASVPAPA